MGMGVLQKAIELKKKKDEEEKKLAQEKMATEQAQELADENPGEYADENHGIVDPGEMMAGDEVPPVENIDVPEIETEITDLPPEDENEKMLTVENTDKTMAEDVGEEDNSELENFDESSVADPEGDMETSVSDEEVASTPAPPQKEEEPPKEPNDEENKDEGGEDENKDEGGEEENKEPEKEEEPPKKETAAERKTKEKKSKSQYEHIPTGVRLAEDTGRVVQTALEDAGNVANTIGKQGTSGTSINDDVRSAVPHYDYRSLFR